MASLDEAKRCPKCDTPGMPNGADGRLLKFLCMNERCRWYSTGWVVQVNPDGTVPETANPAKEFPMSEFDRANFDKRQQQTEETIRSWSKEGA